MAGRRNRIPVIRTKIVLTQTPSVQNNSTQNKGWDTRIAFLSSIAAIVANILTYCSLQETRDQNRKSDEHYIENDSSNRKKDSIQRHDDSIQLQTLVDTYKDTKAEYARLRERDLEQIALLRKDSKLRDEELEIIRRNNSPAFNPVFEIQQQYGVTSNIIPFSVKVFLENVGRANAQQTKVSFFVVTVDPVTNKVVYHSQVDSAILVREIRVGKTDSLGRYLNASVLYGSGGINQNSTNRKAPNSFPQPYVHILIARVAPNNGFISKTYDDYYTNSYVCTSAGRDTYRFNYSTRSIPYSLLKKYIVNYGFDYNVMIKQLGNEYTYVRSQYHYQN